MTIRQLFETGVRKVRLPIWNKFAFIELHEVGGFLSPLGTLYDIGCNGRDLLLTDAASDEYEAWNEAPDWDAEYARRIYTGE